MKNYEKYADEIRAYKSKNFCYNFVKPHILKTDNCSDMTCSTCQMIQMLWLLEDYEEPEIDWSKVKVDTPVLVKNKENDEWKKRHFAKYKDGDVYTWDNGHTSNESSCMVYYKYAKLAEDEKKCEEPEVDWSKVEVDTPILVRNIEYGEWFKRHFAEYKNGKVYTWDNGYTSWTACGNIIGAWKYAKLAESNER